MNQRSTPEDKMLNRITALLAKAESTEFPDEAQAFTAEAQKLMARHAITEAMIQSTQPSAFAPARKTITIPNPYWRSKAFLLSGIAKANGCRTIFKTYEHQLELFGSERDIANSELLFTSLLIHATRVMTSVGSVKNDWGDNNTRSYRKSFLDGFGLQIEARLRMAADEAEREAVEDLGGDLLPVLASRKAVIDAFVDETYPSLGKIGRSVSSHAGGFRAGISAASNADLPGAGRIGA